MDEKQMKDDAQVKKAQSWLAKQLCLLGQAKRGTGQYKKFSPENRQGLISIHQNGVRHARSNLAFWLRQKYNCGRDCPMWAVADLFVGASKAFDKARGL